MTRKANQAALWIAVSLAFVLAIIPALAETDDEAQAREALWLTDRAALVHKIKTLVIGDVDLKDVTIDQALDFLRHQTKLADPDHKGINFVFLKKDQSTFNTYKFSVNLKNATVAQVLQQFPQLLGPHIGDFVVTLEFESGEGAYQRIFPIRDNSLAIKPSMLTDKDKLIYDVRPLFEAKGLKFTPGASAVYDLPAKTLTVVSGDPELIIRVDELLVFGFKTKK